MSSLYSICDDEEDEADADDNDEPWSLLWLNSRGKESCEYQMGILSNGNSWAISSSEWHLRI